MTISESEDSHGYHVMVHEGHNYRITCQSDSCDYDKVSSTEWAANDAARSHELKGVRHSVCVTELDHE